MNGSVVQVMWTQPDGWVALRFVNGPQAGEAWEIQQDESEYGAGIIVIL